MCMEPLEEDNTAPPSSRAVSFTFQKKVSSSKVRRDVESSRNKKEKEGRDFVLSLEGKEIQRFVIYELIVGGIY